MNEEPQRPGSPVDPPPPLLGTWRRWYALVILELVIVILASYVVTEAFR
ncbi:MAG: hypothetical protein AABY75_08060 [Bacteroidota bacterium]|mgnify:FL=1